MSDEIDSLLPAQRVYAMSVVAAEKKYREAVRVAREERDMAVSEALATCQRVMQMDIDGKGDMTDG